MDKIYNQQVFVNDTEPALSAENLNILTKAVSDIDDRVIDFTTNGLASDGDITTSADMECRDLTASANIDAMNNIQADKKVVALNGNVESTYGDVIANAGDENPISLISLKNTVDGFAESVSTKNVVASGDVVAGSISLKDTNTRTVFTRSATFPSNIKDTANEKIKSIDVLGNSWQNGTPTPSSPETITDASTTIRLFSNDKYDPSKFVIGKNYDLTDNAKTAICDIEVKAYDIYDIMPVRRTPSPINVYVTVYEFASATDTTPTSTITINYNQVTSIAFGKACILRVCYTMTTTFTEEAFDWVELHLTSTYPNTITLPYTLRSVGDVKDELYVNADGTGKYVQRVGVINLATLEWGYQSEYTRFAATLSDKATTHTVRTEDVLCNIYSCWSRGGSVTDVTDKSIYTGGTNTDIFIKDTSYTDATTFKNMLSSKSAKFYYELATAVTTTLTASQVSALLATLYKGSTYVSSEVSGSLTYQADVKSYIDNGDDEVREEIAESVVTKSVVADGVDLLDRTSFPLTASIPSTLTDSSSESIKALDVVGYSEQYISDNIYKVVSGTKSGVTFTIQSDGGIKISGTATEDIQWQSNISASVGTYTISYTLSGTTPTGLYIRTRNASSAIDGVSLNVSGTSGSGTFTPTTDIAMTCLTLIHGNTYDCVIYIMMNSGSTALPYEKYTGTPTPTNPISIVDADGEITSTSSDGTSNSITLPYTLRSIGDVHDEIVVNEDGSGSYIQRIGQIDLAKQTFTYYGIYDESQHLFYSDAIANKSYHVESEANYLCERYVGVPNSYIHQMEDGQFRINTISRIYIDAESYSDADTFNAWINSLDHCYLNYILATEVTTPLTSAQVSAILALQTYKTTSVIECEVSGDLTYQGDVKTYAEDNYSYDEVKIGKWADGKDLYRMVISATTPSTASATTDIASLPSTVSVKRIDGCFYLYDGSAVPLGFYGSDSNKTFIYCTTTKVKMNVTSNYLSRPCEIIVEYTK